MVFDGIVHRSWALRAVGDRHHRRTLGLANKTARIIWAIVTNGERYREPVVQAA
jgi:hypothetical protein